MTAIGAMPEGFDPPTADEIDRVDGPTIAAWAADVRQWLVGPYTGASTPATLRYRALALVAVAEGAAAGLTTPTAQAAGVQPPPVPGVSTASEPHSPAGVVARGRAGGLGAQDQTGLIEPRDPDPATDAAPGSDADPAYTSPTPVAGERIEPRDPDAPGEGQQPVPNAPEQP